MSLIPYFPSTILEQSSNVGLVPLNQQTVAFGMQPTLLEYELPCIQPKDTSHIRPILENHSDQ